MITRNMKELPSIVLLLIMAATVVTAIYNDIPPVIIIDLAIILAITILLFALITFLQKRPDFYNIPFKISPENKDKANHCTFRYINQTKILTIAYLAFISVSIAFMQSGYLFSGLTIFCIAMAIATFCYYRKMRAL